MLKRVSAAVAADVCFNACPGSVRTKARRVIDAIRIFALAAMLFGFAPVGSALAQSATCTQFVNGLQTNLNPGAGQTQTFLPGGFLAAGDYLTVTVTSVSAGSGSLIFLRTTPPGAPSIFGSLPVAVGGSIRFTLADANEQIDFSNQTGGPVSVAVTVTCGAEPKGPTNSQILEQTRQTFSKVAAQTSAVVTGDAASGAISDAFSGGGTTQIDRGSFRTSFSAIEGARGADDEKSLASDSDPFAALAYGKKSVAYAKSPFRKSVPKVQSQWHAWIDGRFTGFDERNAASFDGWQSNITGGASYRFTDNFLAGVLVGYENFKYALTAAGVPTSLNGNGVSGGGYFGWKFYDRMRLDGMLTYGRIDYAAGAGGVTGTFGADRITGMTKLSGRYGFGDYFIEPSSMLTIASERQGSFADTAGVFHDKFNFLVGRSSNGAMIGKPMAWGAVVVTPTFGAFADYRFGDQTTAAANVVPTFNNGWSAHVNGGLSVATVNGVTASATGEYGGLGDSIRYWRAKGALGVKF